VDEESIRTELKSVRPDIAETYPVRVDTRNSRPENLAELTLLAIVLEDTSFIKRIEEEPGFGKFKDKSISAILEKIGHFYKSGKKVTPSHLISYFEDNKIEEVVSEAVNIGQTIQDKNKGFGDCIRYIRKRDLKEALKGSTDINEINKLLKSSINKK